MKLKEVLEMANDMTKNVISQNYADEAKNSDALRQLFKEVNGGKETLDWEDLHMGSPLYTIYKETIPVIIEEGLKADDFFARFVNYHNVALGDDIEFEVPDRTELVVAEATWGTDGIRRQRLDGASSYKLDTHFYVIKIYDEYKRFYAGRTKWNELMNKVSEAMKKELYTQIHTVFAGLSQADLGATYYPAKDSAFNETNLLTLIAHVEAATGKKAIICGTKLALNKVVTAVVAEKAKEDIYDMGYYGKFNSTPMFELRQFHLTGTDTFGMPDDKLWILTSDAKPIAVLNKGVGVSYTKHPFENADHTMTHYYGQEFGVGVLYFEKAMGIYEFA